MKLTLKLTMTMALVVGLAWANAAVPGRTVAVCLHKNADLLTLERAQGQASKMFATAGVKIEWREPRLCPAGAILVSLSEFTPASEHPAALAYALPFEGTHIVLFYDRIQTRSALDPNERHMILAHVMVHEITHILQGTDRHSVSGVMKAHWDDLDFTHMRFKPLPFTELDIELIHRGMDERSLKGEALRAAGPVPEAGQ
jgi:hypothetical protein